MKDFLLAKWMRMDINSIIKCGLFYWCYYCMLWWITVWTGEHEISGLSPYQSVFSFFGCNFYLALFKLMWCTKTHVLTFYSYKYYTDFKQKHGSKCTGRLNIPEWSSHSMAFRCLYWQYYNTNWNSCTARITRTGCGSDPTLKWQSSAGAHYIHWAWFMNSCEASTCSSKI